MGPLSGYTIIELAGIGPGPMAGMMLADMGAEVIRVERSAAGPRAKDASNRGKKSVVLNLKEPSGKDALLRMLEKADGLIEGYRPGVTEKMGLGPEQCFAVNPKLIYGRMTGWGQDGPMAKAAGHDINYIALTGALYATGRAGEKPLPPLNLVGDMGGGGMLLVIGMLAALLEAKQSGMGQVIDAAMVDGAAQLMWMFHGMQAAGMWNAEKRGVNLLDGAAHFYDTYETADGQYISLGSIEPQFYAQLVELAELDVDMFKPQMDQSLWPALSDELTRVFRTKTQAQWCEIMEGTDVCFAPVLSLIDAPSHPHNKVRDTYIEIDGYMQPAPAPRFGRTPSEVQHGERAPGEDGESVLASFGFDAGEIAGLKSSGVLA